MSSSYAIVIVPLSVCHSQHGVGCVKLQFNYKSQLTLKYAILINCRKKVTLPIFFIQPARAHKLLNCSLVRSCWDSL